MAEISYKHTTSPGSIKPYVDLDVSSIDELKMATNTREQSVGIFEATQAVLDPNPARIMFEQHTLCLPVNKKVHYVLHCYVMDVALPKLIRYFDGGLDMFLG